MISLPVYIHQCAPHIAPITMQAIVKTESNGNPLAIGINHGYRLKYPARNNAEASKWVEYLERHNYNFDVGLGQVNIKNIHKYGYTATEALDPCTNLKLASLILSKNYANAKNGSKSTNDALRKALSAYNTGNYRSGFHNGYVRKVLINAGKLIELASNDVPPLISTSGSDKNQIHDIKSDDIDSKTTVEPEKDPLKSKTVIYVQPHIVNSSPEDAIHG